MKQLLSDVSALLRYLRARPLRLCACRRPCADEMPGEVQALMERIRERAGELGQAEAVEDEDETTGRFRRVWEEISNGG